MENKEHVPMADGMEVAVGHTYLYLTGFLGSRQQGKGKIQRQSKGEKERKGTSVGNIIPCRAARAPVPRVAREGQGMLQKATGRVADNQGKLEAWKDELGEEKIPSFAGMLLNLDAALLGG